MQNIDSFLLKNSLADIFKIDRKDENVYLGISRRIQNLFILERYQRLVTGRVFLEENSVSENEQETLLINFFNNLLSEKLNEIREKQTNVKKFDSQKDTINEARQIFVQINKFLARLIDPLINKIKEEIEKSYQKIEQEAFIEEGEVYTSEGKTVKIPGKFITKTESNYTIIETIIDLVAVERVDTSYLVKIKKDKNKNKDSVGVSNKKESTNKKQDNKKSKIRRAETLSTSEFKKKKDKLLELVKKEYSGQEGLNPYLFLILLFEPVDMLVVKEKVIGSLKNEMYNGLSNIYGLSEIKNNIDNNEIRGIKNEKDISELLETYTEIVEVIENLSQYIFKFTQENIKEKSRAFYKHLEKEVDKIEADIPETGKISLINQKGGENINKIASLLSSYEIEKKEGGKIVLYPNVTWFSTINPSSYEKSLAENITSFSGTLFRIGIDSKSRNEESLYIKSFSPFLNAETTSSTEKADVFVRLTSLGKKISRDKNIEFYVEMKKDLLSQIKVIKFSFDITARNKKGKNTQYDIEVSKVEVIDSNGHKSNSKEEIEKFKKIVSNIILELWNIIQKKIDEEIKKKIENPSGNIQNNNRQDNKDNTNNKENKSIGIDIKDIIADTMEKESNAGQLSNIYLDAVSALEMLIPNYYTFKDTPFIQIGSNVTFSLYGKNNIPSKYKNILEGFTSIIGYIGNQIPIVIREFNITDSRFETNRGNNNEDNYKYKATIRLELHKQVIKQLYTDKSSLYSFFSKKPDKNSTNKIIKNLEKYNIIDKMNYVGSKGNSKEGLEKKKVLIKKEGNEYILYSLTNEPITYKDVIEYVRAYRKEKEK